MAQNICVVIGKPRGFTRSVLEALLKRGSHVMMVCSESDATIAKSELNRLGYSFVCLFLTSINSFLRKLYNSQRLQFSTIQEKCMKGRDIDQMFSKVQGKCGNINLIVNSEKCRYKEFSSHLESLGKEHRGHS